jgi:hypothetical protein
MGVHVNEVHTDVVPAGRQHRGPAEKNTKASSDSQWLEIRWLAERCSLRVRAEGFSD